MSVYVYASDCTDFDNFGLCGQIPASECVHEERAGGLSQLTLILPPDKENRHRYLAPGCILKAPVPIRTLPEIDTEGQLVSSLEQWRTSATATKAARTLYTKPSTDKGKKIRSVPAGQIVTVVSKNADNWCKVRAGIFGSGWMKRDALELFVTEIPQTTTDTVDEIETAYAVRDQLFRIAKREATPTEITIIALHISYDLLGNLCNYRAMEATAPEILNGILDTCKYPHDFTARTDISDARHEIEFERLNPIKAMLDPEVGFQVRFGAQLVRDNFELCFLKKAGRARGVRIEYGKNLLGIECEVSYDKIVTGIMPTGENDDGSILLLDGDPVVESSRVGEYPVPRVQVLKVSGAKVSKQTSLQVARARMREATEQQFKAGCDLPTLRLKVDFLKLGDAEGFEQYAALEELFLYDQVTLSHKPLGIELETQIVSVQYDCLRGRFREIELGSAQGDLLTGSIGTWQIPSVHGSKIVLGSISGAALSDDIITTRHLQAETITADHIQTNALYAQKIVAAVCELVSANIQQAQIGQAQINWADIVNLNALIGSVAKAQITSAAINEARIDWAEIVELTACMAQIAKAQLTTASIQQADIEWAQIGSIQSAVAEIAQASMGDIEVDYAKIKDTVTGTAIITEGLAGQLFINRLAVTEANMVSLTVGELVVRGDDGALYALKVGPSGTVTTEKKMIQGTDVADGSVPASKLVESSITSREIDVSQLFADEIMAHRIKANHVDIADLFGSSASFGKITSNHLSAEVGANLDLRSNLSIRMMTANDYVMVDDEGVTIGQNNLDSHFKVNITPNSVNILQDGEKIAYFQGNKLHAFEAQISQTLTIGTWTFEVDPDGSLSLYKLW